MKSKGAQIGSFDLTVAMAIFLVGIMIFFIYSVNQSDEAQENFELLFYEGKVVSNNLMSEGYPSNWNSTQVMSIGVMTQEKINQTKLEQIYNMIYDENNYSKTKNLLNTQYDYYFFLEGNMTIDGNSVDGIGKPGETRNSISPKNLIKIKRFTIYQNKTTPLYIYVWE
jgi:hypothetical protein